MLATVTRRRRSPRTFNRRTHRPYGMPAIGSRRDPPRALPETRAASAVA
jgi:hypothetical protein